MDDPGSLILKIVLLFILILVNAFFAMSELAIISLNDNKIEKMAEDGNKKAKKIAKLTENSSRFLSMIQIGVTLAGFLTSASASTTFAEILTQKVMTEWPTLPEKIISGVSIVIITIITSYFSLVLGELVPKKIAMQASEKISFKIVGVLLFFSKIFSPLVKVLAVSTNAVVRLLGFNPHADEETVTEEEIRMMVDVGGEKGVIEDVQKEMINNIFEFDDLDAGDTMTHRTDMVAVEVNDSLQDVLDVSVENGYSRIPVYEDDQDNIIGIVYIKDLLEFVGKELPDKTLRDFMRKPLYVPESKVCGDLFKEMTEKRTQMAVVVDEYGGTAGIVTLEDIIEAIVGNIQDEYDDEDEEISKIDETTFTIDGVTNLEEVEELTGVEIPQGSYDTLAGFIIKNLGFLPQKGEIYEVIYENLKFTVLDVDERRIEKVRVEISPKEEEEPEERKLFNRDRDKD